jgi:hypothetical protein
MRRSALGALLLLCASTSFAATRTWTGTTNGQWTLAANWGGTAPVAGDSLVFPSGASNLSNTNDFPANTQFQAISVVGAGYTLSGNTVDLGSDILGSYAGTSTIALNFRLTPLLSLPAFVTETAGTLILSGDINLNGHRLEFDTNGGNVTASGVISGTGPLESITKDNPGDLTLSGANTFSSDVGIISGRLIAANPTALGVADNTLVNGTIVIAGGTLVINGVNIGNEYVQIDGSGQGGNGVLQSQGAGSAIGGTVELVSSSVAMNLGTPNALAFNGPITGAGRFGMGGSGTYIINSSGNTFTGAVQWAATGTSNSTLRLGASNALPNTVSLNIGSGGLFDVNGRTQTIASLSGPGNASLGVGGTLTITNPTGAFDGTMSGSGAVLMTGGNSLWDSPNTFTGTFTHSGGTFLLNGTTGGSLAAAFTQSLGTFGISSGATASSVTINGGTFAPGNGGLGNANTGNLALAPAATYSEVINGTAAGTFGNIHVTGTVALGGAALLLTGFGAGVAPGNTITVIDNDGVDPVGGTFAGLPQGAVIVGGPGGFPYQISYTGGTGNDVVLTALAATAIPALDPRALAALALLLGMIAVVSLRR